MERWELAATGDGRGRLRVRAGVTTSRGVRELVLGMAGMAALRVCGARRACCAGRACSAACWGALRHAGHAP
jgi:hypothetical protein